MSDMAARGSVIAGRYRVGEQLPDDIPSATTYAAVDAILDRPVRVRLLPASQTGALDAARRAALVTDSRLQRVLDIGTLASGQGYVVSEQVAGPSLAELLASGPLSPDQARAVIGEASGALEVARRRGVHHLAVRPSVVHLAQDGRVVVAGLAVDALLLGRRENDEVASRYDALDLVRLLYACLTGTWPGPAESAASVGLPPAPVDPLGDPLPPRLVVADVAGDLSTLCAVALGHRDDGPRTAAEVVRALEPWGEIRVAPAPAPAPAPTSADGPPPDRPTETVVIPGALGDAGASRPQVPRQSIRAAFEQDRGSVRPGTPPPAAQQRPAAPPAGGAGAVPTPGAPSAADVPVAPAWAARAVPAPTAPVSPSVAQAPTGHGPTTDPTPAAAARTTYGSRRRFDPTRLVLAVVAVAVLVGLVLALTSLFAGTRHPATAAPTARTSSATTTSPSPTTSTSTPTSTPTPSRTGAAFQISGITTYDPVDPAGEHPELTARAFDADPSTFWNTRTYKNATFGGLKKGVALIVTLGHASTVHTVTLATTGTGGQVEIRPPSTTDPAGGKALASGPLTLTTTFTLTPATELTSFVVWISQLPTAPDGTFRLELSEITVG